LLFTKPAPTPLSLLPKKQKEEENSPLSLFANDKEGKAKRIKKQKELGKHECALIKKVYQQNTS